MELRLPSEYQEVEYIESTGTQYIDTGVTLGTNDFTILFNFEQTKRTSGEQPITSIWTSDYNYWNLFIRSVSSDESVLDVYTSAHHMLSTEVNLNEKYTVSLTRNENSWELTQGDSTISWTYSPSKINNTTLKLFKRGDLTNAHSTKIKMYSFKMAISNTKTLNLIPCYRKSDGEIGMYDTVTKTFYTNSGTDIFLKGADVTRYIDNVSVLDTRRKILLNTPHIDTSVGDLVTFNTDLSAPLKSCKVSFSPVQEGEGDPSPDNVRNITGWNGINIYKTRQNLIPENIPAQFYRVYPTASQGTFVESGTAFSTFIIPVPKGKICLARTTRNLISYGALCDEPPTVGSNAFNVVTMTNRNNHIFDNLEGHKYFAITTGRKVEANSDWDSFLNTEPRLTIGDTVQPYTAPTNISTHSIDWTDSVGTVYGGYIDLVSGELVQTWYGFILDGVNNYLNSGSQLLNNGLATIYDYIGSGGLNNLPKGPVNTYTGAIICNKFPLAYSRENEGIATGSGSLYIRLILDPSKLEDVSSTSAIKESMIKWQQENPLQIVYKLAEPIHYQLTPQQLSTFKGINNIYSNTNGQTEIKYWKH